MTKFEREDAKNKWFERDEGYYCQLIKDMGINPEEIEGYNVVSFFEQFFEKALRIQRKKKKDLEKDPNPYYY